MLFVSKSPPLTHLLPENVPDRHQTPVGTPVSNDRGRHSDPRIFGLTYSYLRIIILVRLGSVGCRRALPGLCLFSGAWFRSKKRVATLLCASHTGCRISGLRLPKDILYKTDTASQQAEMPDHQQGYSTRGHQPVCCTL